MKITIAKQDLYIWWTNQRDAERADASDLSAWPEELRAELVSRMGRAGHGRLWIPSEWEWDGIGVEWKERDPMFNALGNHYGGIVFRREHLTYLKDLPGLITDFDMKHVQGTWVNAPYASQP